MFGPYAPNGYLASNPLFGLAASLAPHGDIPSALRPCPLTAIFLRPCGLNRFSIQLTPNVEFFFLTPPHDKINFLFALRWMSILFIFLTPPHGKIDFLFALQWMPIFFLRPLMANQFSICLMASVDFITLMPPCGDISFTPHGGNQCSLCLTVRLGFIPIMAICVLASRR